MRPNATTSARTLSFLTDTFQVHTGTLQLFPVTQTSFNRLAGSALPQQPDSTDSPSIRTAHGQVHRQGSRLVFALDDDNKTVVQDDTTNTDQASTHYYWGQLSKAHQWVLFVGYWEGTGALLVDQRTGQKTSIWGHPVASPDGKYIVTYSYDMAYNPTGLQLYQVDSNGIHQLWERNTNWGPVDVKWLGNQAIAIKKQDLPDSPESWLGLKLTPNLKK